MNYYVSNVLNELMIKAESNNEICDNRNAKSAEGGVIREKSVVACFKKLSRSYVGAGIAQWYSAGLLTG
jgi:hypothetical protein